MFIVVLLHVTENRAIWRQGGERKRGRACKAPHVRSVSTNHRSDGDEQHRDQQDPVDASTRHASDGSGSRQKKRRLAAPLKSQTSVMQPVKTRTARSPQNRRQVFARTSAHSCARSRCSG